MRSRVVRVVGQEWVVHLGRTLGPALLGAMPGAGWPVPSRTPMPACQY